MKPTHHKTTWQVYTTSELYRGEANVAPSWSWVAHGPRGSDAGVETTSEVALSKAYAASMLLSDGNQ